MERCMALKEIVPPFPYAKKCYKPSLMLSSINSASLYGHSTPFKAMVLMRLNLDCAVQQYDVTIGCAIMSVLEKTSLEKKIVPAAIVS